MSNIPKNVLSKIDKKLYQISNHPVCIIKELIYDYFMKQRNFHIHENISPYVSVKNNFDKLLIPENHPSRSRSDTYYLNDETVLRTHTSAHQNDILEKGDTSFLVTGDVYRNDEINATHYPVFHQMEGVYIDVDNKMDNSELVKDLIDILKGLCEYLFPSCPIKVSPDYFPFTDPSFEIEVFYNNKWLEILGCGIIRQEIIKNCSNKNKKLVDKKGWAFGLGLDRLAMILFDIPDIRILWLDNPKFMKQFKPKTITKFVPFSKLDTIYRDIAFYIPPEQLSNEKWLNENDMYQIMRNVCDNISTDIISNVEMIDRFYNEKKALNSRTYRIYYCSPDPNLNNPAELTKIVNNIHDIISDELKKLNLIIR